MATHPAHIHCGRPAPRTTVRSAAAPWLAFIVVTVAVAWASPAVYAQQRPEVLLPYGVLVMVWVATWVQLANTPRRRRRGRWARAVAALRRLTARREPWPLRQHAMMTATCTFAFVVFAGITWGAL